MKISMQEFGNRLQIKMDDIFSKLNFISDNLINIFKYEIYSDEWMEQLNIMKTYIYDKLSDAYIGYFQDIQTILLELYSLARIYKTMIKSMNIHPSERKKEDNTDATHPLIAMFYFGQFHIENMKKLLNDYTSTFKVDENDDKNLYRCLNFSKDYDLDDKIEKLKNTRKKYEERLK
jgi:hypothetical protein